MGRSKKSRPTSVAPIDVDCVSSGASAADESALDEESLFVGVCTPKSVETGGVSVADRKRFVAKFRAKVAAESGGTSLLSQLAATCKRWSNQCAYLSGAYIYDGWETVLLAVVIGLLVLLVLYGATRQLGSALSLLTQGAKLLQQ